MKTELRTEFRVALGKKAVLLETYVEMRVNEVRQYITSTLEQLQEIVGTVSESQERMWRAIDRMSGEVQELVQRDTSTEGEEETEPLPVVENPAEEELVFSRSIHNCSANSTKDSSCIVLFLNSQRGCG